ncbi:MAG: hypothetical protein GX613_03200 [Chloroflexi bacterium]|nr:hypothetical protein [Chloroflexota bacterium]
MPQVNIFNWRPGSGWIVLSGGGDWLDGNLQAVEAAMLTRTLSQGPMAYLWAAGDVDTADRHMDALRDLGARTGYLIDLVSEEDDVIYNQISEAGVIVLGDGPNARTLRDALDGIALSGIQEAFDRGSTIYAAGASAAMMGAAFVERGALVDGIGWLASAVIMPGYSPDQAADLRAWVRGVPDGYGLGLGAGAGIAFGPRGEVEVLGSGAVTVSLGQRFDPDAEQTGRF